MEVCKHREEDIIDFVDHELLTNGTREEISEVLQQRINVNCFNSNGDTVLHSILRNEKLVQKDVVEFLTLCLVQGVDPNLPSASERGETALQLAVERRMKEAVNCLLKRAANRHIIDHRSGNGIGHFFIEDEYERIKMAMLYPRMNTAENRKITENCSRDFAKFLLDVGVDFDRKNAEGMSAFHLAITYDMQYLLPALLERAHAKDYKEFIQNLLSDISFGDISACNSKYDCILLLLLYKALTGNNHGRTTVSIALNEREEMSNIKTMIYDYLIECENVNIATYLFEELTSTCALWEDSAKDYFSTVLKDLIAHGVDINEVQFRKRLFRTAIKAKNIWLLEFLREMGMIFVGLELKNGKNLIGTIAEEINFNDESSRTFCKELITLLVGSGYELNSQDRYGKTALQVAIDYGRISMVRILIECGVDLNCRDMYRRTALHRALIVGYPYHFTTVSPLRRYGTAKLGLPHRVEDPNYLRWSPTSRSCATQEGAKKIVHLLIRGGVDVNARDSMLNTALHIAVFHEDGRMVKLLLDGNANVNAEDNEGNTPLQLVLILKNSGYNKDLMKMLLERGACPNVRNKRMETPLELALLHKTKLAEELLRYNADVNDANIRQMVRDLHDDEVDPRVRTYYLKIGTLPCLWRHWTRLMAANLPIDDEYKEYLAGNIDEKYHEQCLKEIEKLKREMIDDQASFYDFLHMHPRGRCAYMQRDYVRQNMESADLSVRFPEISVLVMASYQEAKVFQKRRTISVVVADIFFRMYNISYENVAEKIVSFLREDDFLFCHE